MLSDSLKGQQDLLCYTQSRTEPPACISGSMICEWYTSLGARKMRKSLELWTNLGQVKDAPKNYSNPVSFQSSISLNMLHTVVSATLKLTKTYLKDLAHVYIVAPKDSRGSITKDTTLMAQLIHNRRQKKTHCLSWATHAWNRSCEQVMCKTGKTFGKSYKQSMRSFSVAFHLLVSLEEIPHSI